MSHTSKQQQKEQPPLAMTVPQVRSLGLTGKGKIPPSKCPLLGQMGGNPKMSSYWGYAGRREQSFKNKLQY